MNDPIVRLVGVYNADATIAGELRYVAGRFLGSSHCALCNLTHGRLRRRADFDARAAVLPVALELFHRNDQPDELRALTDGRLPCIVGIRASGGRAVVVMDEQLKECSGDVDRLVALLESLV